MTLSVYFPPRPETQDSICVLERPLDCQVAQEGTELVYRRDAKVRQGRARTRQLHIGRCSLRCGRDAQDVRQREEKGRCPTGSGLPIHAEYCFESVPLHLISKFFLIRRSIGAIVNTP